MMKTILATAALACLATALPASAQNVDLVTNGDFEAGSAGFTSTYTQNGNASDSNPATYTPPGAYYIQTGGNHTPGGNTWIDFDTANAATDASYYWSETFAVAPGSTYALSYWTRNVNAGGPAPSPFAQVNGVTIQGPTVVSSGDWTQLTGTWDSGTATSATLQLFNADHAYSYNDLGVDDISFVGPAAPGAAGAVPEAATWGMMILGMGAVGFAMRRRPASARLSYAI